MVVRRALCAVLALALMLLDPAFLHVDKLA
jgi:hypothetical protein